MGTNSKIEWTDHTWNPWRGCQHATVGEDQQPHPGCDHCYAEAMAKRNPGTLGQWGDQGTRVVAAEEYWKLPLKWDAEAKAEGVRRRVFCASLADVFEKWDGPMLGTKGAPLFDVGDGQWRPDAEINRRAFPGFDPSDSTYSVTLDDVRRRLFALIDATPNLDWLVLTKRPQHVRSMWTPTATGMFRPNVWLLTSVSDQATADALVPELLKLRDLVPALGLSIEPLLGPVDLSRWLHPFNAEPSCDHCEDCVGLIPNWLERTSHNHEPLIDWIIVGGESGHHTRPMHPQWARDLRDQCQAAGVSFHFKQWGEWVPSTMTPTSRSCDAWLTRDGRRLVPVDGIVEATAEPMARVGKKAAGRELDGRTWDEFPEVAHG